MSWEFFLTSLVIVASPGTGVLITLTAGLTRGRRAAIVAAFGGTLGIIPHMIAAITGIAAILHASALAFEVIRYAGVAYLLYMAWQTLRENGALAIDDTPSSRTDFEVIRSAILVNILNPKLSIFFFAFLPQFVGTQAGTPVLEMLELSLVFMAMTFVVFVIYGIFAAAVRSHVVSRPSVLTVMRRTFAAAFVGLGIKLALTER
ncbi:LysE family translocator [Allorhizobium borbori]|uniref:Threonine/homoserine/homoserine lactone efflux protein n=1 Tax=Allorhizobium borbori TaxID=485907 RepID=A0A7W6K4W2_9HYPH|nr:LysE family translocator [Allorhizobium borbori]MBB4105255.1 threonine/homoserine/homoserine lactone efflux protein [Allorhizobium borbori]